VLSEHEQLVEYLRLQTVQLEAISSGILTVAQLISNLSEKIAQVGDPKVSSAEVKTSTRGVDVAAKAYAGSDVTEATNQAVAEYFRALDMVAEETARRIDGPAVR